MKNIYILARSCKEANSFSELYKKEGYTIVGIEAEWGESIPECDLFIGHHGKFASEPPPCTRWEYYNKFKENTVFIYSHLDLDSLYATWIFEGRVTDNEFYRGISDNIAFIDLHGAHKYIETKSSYKKYVEYLYHFFKKNYKKINNDNIRNFMDNVWNKFTETLYSLSNLSSEDVPRDKSQIHIAAYNALDKKMSIPGLLHVFLSNANFTSFYEIKTEDWESRSLVNIQYNSATQKISIGVIDEKTAISIFGPGGIIPILKKYFGEDAGGRVSIGGSPRHKKTNFTTFLKMVREIKQKVLEYDRNIKLQLQV